MATSYFLKLDGVDGEAKDSDHKDWIQVQSFSWGVAQSSHFARGGGSTGGTGEFQTLTINHEQDVASPTLMLKCAKGDHIPKATLECIKSSGDQKLVYYKVEMEMVLIADTSVSGSEGGAGSMETVSLSAKKVKFEYTAQNEDGSKGKTVGPHTWDISKNAEG